MNNKRIFVKQIDKYDSKSSELLNELKIMLNASSLTYVKIYNIYDLYNINLELYSKTKYTIFAKINVNKIENKIPDYEKYLAYELLPLQFDNRADSAMQLMQIYNSKNLDVKITTGTFIGFNSDLTEKDLLKIKKYLINPIEQREKNLNTISLNINLTNKNLKVVEDFFKFDDRKLKEFAMDNNYSLSYHQMKNIWEYFWKEKRKPNYSELMMFDIYWSDHCRHTTFNTKINDVIFKLEDKKLKNEIEKTFKSFFAKHQKIKNKNDFTLMDISLITRRELEKENKLKDLEKSKEINAISIEVKIKNETHYLVFKNETHNHPSEIEPFSGASTCLGGAMRDIFAARAYCFAGMRISGCGNILEKNKNTMQGKLPQYKIARNTAKGFSSYGNQVGLSTQFIDEYYHPSYTAKHLECGAVLGVVPKKWVVKKEPAKNDLIMLIGAKTGIDGIGGASGSSKKQDEESVNNSYNEVQKGNPIIARKMQRLYFSNKNFIKIIKRSNDFGAGGASVAIGEIADGVEIYLDKFKTKYLNITPSEILFSESQERMAMVISPNDKDKFIKYVNDENLDAYEVGKVTNDGKVKAFYNKELIVNVSKQFLNEGAYINSESAIIKKDSSDILNKSEYDLEKATRNLTNKIKKGLVEMFDNTIGTNSKYSNMGGKYLLTKNDCLISKIPSQINHNSEQNVIITTGFNPQVASKSPYHMGYYSIVEAIAKMATKQIDIKDTKISLQEYFPKLNSKEKWGVAFSALLGAYKVLDYFNLPVVGGKDSMSGTYKDLDVIPTIIAFAINTFKDKKIITNEFKNKDSYIYLLHNKLDKNNLINLKQFNDNIKWFKEQNHILAAQCIAEKSLDDTLIHMALGNKINFKKLNLNNRILNKAFIGDIIFQTNNPDEIKNRNVLLIGKINKDNKQLIINQKKYLIQSIVNKLNSEYENVYPFNSYKETNIDYTKMLVNNIVNENKINNLNQSQCNVLHPIFPGTNCEYDTIKQFSKVSKLVNNDVFVFKNQTHNEVENSIEELAKRISKADIIMLNGGFSLADEPDGSAKYIACILNHEKIKKALKTHLKNKKLILGICNGFQALINAGLLPKVKFKINEEWPLLNDNPLGKHISTIVNIKYLNVNSPWINNKSLNSIFKIPISHGEGSFNANDKTLEKLIRNNQIVSVYSNDDGKIIATNEINPNDSMMNIEGIISDDGLVLGKMGHSERVSEKLYQNINKIIEDPLFENGVKYILGKNFVDKGSKNE